MLSRKRCGDTDWSRSPFTITRWPYNQTTSSVSIKCSGSKKGNHWKWVDNALQDRFPCCKWAKCVETDFGWWLLQRWISFHHMHVTSACVLFRRRSSYNGLEEPKTVFNSLSSANSLSLYQGIGRNVKARRTASSERDRQSSFPVFQRNNCSAHFLTSQWLTEKFTPLYPPKILRIVVPSARRNLLRWMIQTESVCTLSIQTLWRMVYLRFMLGSAFSNAYSTWPTGCPIENGKSEESRLSHRSVCRYTYVQEE